MNRSVVRMSTAFILIVMCAAQVRSETRYVPADYATIQAAINVSIDGDTVEIAPGFYWESFDYIGKAITVRCPEPLSCFFDSTIGLQIVISNVRSGTAVLENICFSRCTCRSGGIVVRHSNAALRNVVCAYNYLEGPLWTGNVLIITDSTVTISDCMFFRNTSSSNALLGGDVVNIFRSDVIFQNCTVDYNRTDRTVSCAESILTMEACTVSRNRSSDCGGGISLTGSSLSLTGSVICDNSSDIYGGGIAMSDMRGVTLRFAFLHLSGNGDCPGCLCVSGR